MIAVNVFKQLMVTNERPELNNHIKRNRRIIEADVTIVSHIAKSIESGLKKVALNDTDIYVSLLHCTPEFIKSGLTELWLEYRN